MGRNTSDDPELLVSPPVVDGHTTPSHLKDAGDKDADEKRHEPDAGNIGKLQFDIIMTVRFTNEPIIFQCFCR
jgi:hypothetical protein